jgi:hypothetical protein
LLREALTPSCACATPFELGRLADGSLARHVAARLRDHVSSCARCQTELTLLKEFEDAAPGPDEEGAVSWISARLERRFSEASAGSSPSRIHGGAALRRRSWFTALNVGGFGVAAATLAVAVTIGLREGRAPKLAQPSAGVPAVMRSSGITPLSPAGDLDAPPHELRWAPRTDAASYSVQVMEVDFAELWSAETRDPSIALPPALRARVVPGKPLLWEVVAKDAAGRAVAWSGKQRFRVRM